MYASKPARNCSKPIPPSAGRRRVLQAAMALLASGPLAVRAQQRVPIADMHSHYGMITRKLADSGLAEDMRSQRVALVAWKLVADGRWIRATNVGIEQSREPAPGDLAGFFNSSLERMKAYVAAQKLRTVLTPADVDACLAGESGIVLASEGADFLEGKVEDLDAAYAKGLRHLQFVHYIRTPVGDFQTVAPMHNGLSAMGKQLVEACNAKGILIDLAHSTLPSVDQALEIAKAPLIWSHGWVDGDGGSWQDPYGFLKRRLSLAHAKKIAARGGVVGLWALGLSRPGLGWSVGARGTQAYAQELANLIDKIGADHVALGTDIEGVGPNWAVNSYGDVRTVLDHLQDMKVPASVIERVAYANYARVLKAVLKAAG
jgi:membrane dipeptidase